MELEVEGEFEEPTKFNPKNLCVEPSDAIEIAKNNNSTKLLIKN